MTPLDDLFSTDESRAEAQLEKVVTLNPAEISDFPNHPFKVKQDEAMAEMVESVRKYGVLVPALVRPKADGGYEMVAGHRRKFAATLAELPEIPCIVRDLTDDEATIIMVDSNLQRETILPSEKASAYAAVEVIRYKSVADTHLKVRADVPAGEYRGMLRLDRPYRDVGIQRFERFADAGDCSSGADAGTEAVDRSRDLLEYLERSVMLVNHGVCGIFKLTGNEDVRVFLCHFQRGKTALLDRVSDVARVVNENHLGTVVRDELAPLYGYAVGHDDLHTVSAHRADQCKSDPLISARRLDDDGVGTDQPAALAVLYHVECGACLYRSAHVKSFVLHKYFGRLVFRHSFKPDHRRVSDSLQHITVYHSLFPFKKRIPSLYHRVNILSIAPAEALCDRGIKRLRVNLSFVLEKIRR